MQWYDGLRRLWLCIGLPQIPAHIPKTDYAVTSIPESERRDRRANTSIRVYTPEEIDGIRAACQIGRLALDAVGNAIRVGVTTAELDRICHEVHVENGAYPSPLNYYKFPCSVCTSVNEVICHGIPDMRELQDGDIVNIDVSTYFGGYHGDLNETFFVGNVDEAGRHLVRTAFGCLSAALDEVALSPQPSISTDRPARSPPPGSPRPPNLRTMRRPQVKPGCMYRDLGKVITKHAEKNKCSVVRTYCGHGIGELFHTAPNVPHYAKNKAKGVMQPGHIFTVEPMINLGSYRDLTWPDDWTAVTIDGERSAQFEHTVCSCPPVPPAPCFHASLPSATRKRQHHLMSTLHPEPCATLTTLSDSNSAHLRSHDPSPKVLRLTLLTFLTHYW